MDLKSIGVSPRRFEPCRLCGFFSLCLIATGVVTSRIFVQAAFFSNKEIGLFSSLKWASFQKAQIITLSMSVFLALEGAAYLSRPFINCGLHPLIPQTLS